MNFKIEQQYTENKVSLIHFNLISKKKTAFYYLKGESDKPLAIIQLPDNFTKIQVDISGSRHKELLQIKKN